MKRVILKRVILVFVVLVVFIGLVGARLAVVVGTQDSEAGFGLNEPALEKNFPFSYKFERWWREINGTESWVIEILEQDFFYDVQRKMFVIVIAAGGFAQYAAAGSLPYPFLFVIIQLAVWVFRLVTLVSRWIKTIHPTPSLPLGENLPEIKDAP